VDPPRVRHRAPLALIFVLLIAGTAVAAAREAAYEASSDEEARGEMDGW
jgi:hypothetical protein